MMFDSQMINYGLILRSARIMCSCVMKHAVAMSSLILCLVQLHDVISEDLSHYLVFDL